MAFRRVALRLPVVLSVWSLLVGFVISWVPTNNDCWVCNRYRAFRRAGPLAIGCVLQAAA